MPRKRKIASREASCPPVSSKKPKRTNKPRSQIEAAADLTNEASSSSTYTRRSESKKEEEKSRIEEAICSVDDNEKEEKEVVFEKKLSFGDEDNDEMTAIFISEPVPDEEARQRWPHRYQEKKRKMGAGVKTSKEDDTDEIIQARCHYTRAKVDGCVIYDLYDDAYVQAGEGEESFICKIVELFVAIDGAPYFTAQWFYRARDTVIQKHHKLREKKRVFFSEIRDDNPLNCLVKKLKIDLIPLNLDLEAKRAAIPVCDYYCDMKYLLPYSTFVTLQPENKAAGSETSSTISSDVVKSDYEEDFQAEKSSSSDVALLDLYSGCGAMSTGLCLGANLFGLKLVTRWAVDTNKHACNSLKLNHPETEVRNESVEDFLLLLKEWKKLCTAFNLIKCYDPSELQSYPSIMEDHENDDSDVDGESDCEDVSEVFEVEKILEICYGDPKEKGDRGLYFKVHWKNYGPDEDTWEPIEGLSNCRDKIKEFVMHVYKSKILPLPGDVDVICGGPPCQGISGYNRFRNKDNPLDDEKNKQLLVFMETVDYLKPRYVLMENVVDILKFANGFLGRYALSRLIDMNYQTRMGMMAAGAYGLPQFRMRFFLWGARPNEKLPQYPLPTHDVVMRGFIPLEFETNTVAYDEGHTAKLEKKLLLEDAISDLPAVGNNEQQDEMPYGKDPQTTFQRFIRLRKDGSLPNTKTKKHLLYDHRPLKLNSDDHHRVCRIPKKKGANFRDLPGVRVRPENIVEWDPKVKRVYLDSGKPLVPNYAMTFVKGTSSKPFARLWWDETVPTVVTRAEPHNQAILHPEQDRVLTVRENARLQGFPDYYKLCGPIKERYVQVGNAVAVPVARALGFALGLAYQGSAGDEPLFTLPASFPSISEILSSKLSHGDA